MLTSHLMVIFSKQKTRRRLASLTGHRTKRSRFLQRYDTFDIDMSSFLKRGPGQMGLGRLALSKLGYSNSKFWESRVYFIFAIYLCASSQLLHISILCLPLAPPLVDMATDIKDKTVLRHVDALSSKLRRRYASAIFASRTPLMMFQSISWSATGGDGNNSPHAPYCVNFEI